MRICLPGPSRVIFLLNLCLASCALFIARPTQAQITHPTAQEFLRQQERERALRRELERAPDQRLERPTVEASGRLPVDETPCFVIEHIELGGDAANRFKWAVQTANFAGDGAADSPLGQCLGARGVGLAMKRIQNAIIARGFVTTRVLAPPQDLKSGTLRLTLIPGRVRHIRFANDVDARATAWNALRLRPGDLLNLRDIEQALENFKRVPTADADIQIVPAEGPDAKPGDSDLVIAWRQALPFRLNVSLDDSGSKSTGKYQGSVTLSYDDLATLNDLFYLSLSSDVGGGDSGERGNRGYTAHYSLPFGYWLLAFTTSDYDYHQAVAGINQTYIYSGESRNSDIRLARLVYRDAGRKTTVYGRAWLRESQNFIDDAEIGVQRRRMAGWEAGLNHREFIGASVLDLDFAYRRGTGAMNALRAPEEDADEGTSRPQIWLLDGQIDVPFQIAGQRLRYSAALRAQLNDTPLVPQDRFSIGGRYTVRGFDGETILTGDSGWLIRNDLGLALGSSGQALYVGLDYGEVGGPSADRLPGRNLAGAVLGLRGRYKRFSHELFVGTPLKEPKGFDANSLIAGFNLNWSI